MIPHRTPFFLPLLYPSLTWRMPADKKELYLSFDDGPVNGPTEFVAEELKKAAVRATFFCIGDNVRKHPEVFKKITTAGHTIGNHTFNHLNGWRTRTADYVTNVKMFDHQLSMANGALSTMFRPPYGRITRRQIRALGEYRIIMWDVLSRDYDKGLSPEKCLRNTIAATRPGSIIVFHDSLKAEKNLVYTLPRFIDHFAGLGYAFKTFAP
jgi:peptidoglycan-N-acetylglucosamine deacetylase